MTKVLVKRVRVKRVRVEGLGLGERTASDSWRGRVSVAEGRAVQEQVALLATLVRID